MRTTTRKAGLTAAALLSTAALAAATVAAAPGASAALEPGSPRNDVTLGLDNDDADNPFVQPPGVVAKQHMEGTDVLLGRAGEDLLVGNEGDDTLLGGRGGDILVGGPETALPNSDVLVGEEGNDVNVWAPGDGSDAFLGQEGFDTMVFAPFQTNDDGSLKLEKRFDRTIPRVKIDALPQFDCTIVPVPDSERLGAQFLVRFNVRGTPVVTVRQKDVEEVYCPSPEAGFALVADLTDPHPVFEPEALDEVPGVVGDILAPAS
ncbi:MAG: hypothetical protein ACRCYR_15150 [Phycicoccus sp.]